MYPWDKIEVCHMKKSKKTPAVNRRMTDGSVHIVSLLLPHARQQKMLQSIYIYFFNAPYNIPFFVRDGYSAFIYPYNIIKKSEN